MRRILWVAVLAGCLAAVPAAAAEGGGRKVAPEVEASVDRILTSGDSVRVRLQAAIVLGHAGTERSLPALSQALSDPHAGVRAAAALALGNLNSPDAVAPLVEHVEDRDPFVRDHISRALLSLRGPAVLRRLAIEAGSAPPAGRAILIRAIAGFDSEEADSALVAFFDERDPSVREVHGAVMAGLPAARRDAVLMTGLGSTCPRVRLGAVRSAGRIAGAAAVEPLLGIALDDDQPKELRDEARLALIGIRELVDPEALDAIAGKSGDPVKRARAVALAVIRGGSTAEGIVLRGLADPAPVVRWTAGRAALDLSPDRMKEAVLSALAAEKDNRVKRSLRRSARMIGRAPKAAPAVAIDEVPEP